MLVSDDHIQGFYCSWETAVHYVFSIPLDFPALCLTHYVNEALGMHCYCNLFVFEVTVVGTWIVAGVIWTAFQICIGGQKKKFQKIFGYCHCKVSFNSK